MRVAPVPLSRRGPLLLVLLAIVALLVPAGAVAKRPAPSTTIQLLNVSDWHGNVDPQGTPAQGGAWNISARWQEDRLAHPTLTLTAGDDFGATPAISNFFEDTPAVLAQRMMGIQVGALGNHNFDAGVGRLQQLVNLAGAPTSASTPGQPFRYVAANLKNLSDNVSGISPVAYFRVGSVKVAVIGITNEEAPSVVAVGAFGTIVPTDGVAAANKFTRIARQNGSQVVVIITHKGVRGFDGSGNPTGELIDFAKGVQGADVILGDHTDVKWSGTINGILVHENRSFGYTYAKTLITLTNGVVSAKSVSFVDPTVTPLENNKTTCPATGYCDQAIVDMLTPIRADLAEIFDGTIGTSTGVFPRGGNVERMQENALADVIADGMRWKYGTDIGFLSGGGVRATMPSGYAPLDSTLRRPKAGDPADATYDLVIGDVYTVLPFGNIVVTRSVTGAQIWAALENGVSQITCKGLGTDGRFPQVSGMKFTFDYNLAPGSRVTAVSLDDGTPIPNSSGSTYTMALPNFTNGGGDSYSMFADGQGVSRDLDANVMLEYMQGHGPNWNPAYYPIGGRITKLGSPTC